VIFTTDNPFPVNDRVRESDGRVWKHLGRGSFHVYRVWVWRSFWWLFYPSGRHTFFFVCFTPPIFIYIIYIYIYIITTKKSNSVSIFVFLSTFRGSLFRIGWGEGKKTKTEWWIKHFFFCQVSLFLNCNLCPWVAMHSEFLYFFFVSVFCVFLWELWKQKWFSLSVVYFQNSVFQLLRVSVFYLQILFLLIERNCHPPSPHI
jgi:hypothetical protein